MLNEEIPVGAETAPDVASAGGLLHGGPDTTTCERRPPVAGPHPSEAMRTPVVAILVSKDSTTQIVLEPPAQHPCVSGVVRTQEGTSEDPADRRW
jgi:hypothetical protein